MWLATTAIVLVTAIMLLTYVYGAVKHLPDEGWSDHCSFHAWQGRIWLVGLNALSLILTLGPLRRGETLALWLLLVVWAFIFGGLFLPALKYREEIGGADKLFFGALAVVYLLSLGRAWMLIRP